MIIPLVQSANESNEPSTEPKPDLSAQGIWQRLAGESAASHTAFCASLELGPDATLQVVANQTGRTLTAIRHLSSRYSWRERAAAWRQHTASIAFAAMETQTVQNEKLWAHRREALRELQWEDSEKLRELYHNGLNQLANDPHTKLKVPELLAFMRLAFKLGHDALGTPVKKTASESTPLSADNDSEFLAPAVVCAAAPRAHSASPPVQAKATVTRPDGEASAEPENQPNHRSTTSVSELHQTQENSHTVAIAPAISAEGDSSGGVLGKPRGQDEGGLTCNPIQPEPSTINSKIFTNSTSQTITYLNNSTLPPRLGSDLRPSDPRLKWTGPLKPMMG
jgi:hypothetical protein